MNEQMIQEQIADLRATAAHELRWVQRFRKAGDKDAAAESQRAADYATSEADKLQAALK